MSNVASLENCMTLHELSGWDETTFCHKTVLTGDELEFRAISLTEDARVGANARFLCPAYDLGYLLRKLPDQTLLGTLPTGSWVIEYNPTPGKFTHEFEFVADTPENATTKLAIELFKQGILTKE